MQAVWADDPSAQLDMPALLKLMDQFSTAYAPYSVRPADYSKVDAAIAAVPRQLNQYTEASVAKLDAALNAVVRGKRQPIRHWLTAMPRPLLSLSRHCNCGQPITQG